MKIKYYEINKIKDKLSFVVMCAMYKNQWVFVRHKDRSTWESPGGHIEDNESPDEAARRELWEETGAIKYKLTPICDYSVEDSNCIRFGRLYYALIEGYEELKDYEIAEITFKDELPSELTYKIVHPILFEKVKNSINKGRKSAN